MTMRDAFVAGYAPSAASPYYSGLALLAEAARGAEGELAHRIGQESDEVVRRRDDALARLDRTADALAALGAPAPDRPADATEYAGWVESVFATADAVLAAGSAGSVAHLLGHVLGEGMATLDALAIVWRLREAAPDHVLLRVQAESLEHERATAERRLGKLAAHPLLPATVQRATASAARAIADRESFDASARALTDHALVIESGLQGGS